MTPETTNAICGPRCAPFAKKGNTTRGIAAITIVAFRRAYWHTFFAAAFEAYRIRARHIRTHSMRNRFSSIKCCFAHLSFNTWEVRLGSERVNLAPRIP